MRNILIVVMLFCGLLCFAESEMGERAIYGGKSYVAAFVDLEPTSFGCTDPLREIHDCERKLGAIWPCRHSYFKLQSSEVPMINQWIYVGEDLTKCSDVVNMCEEISLKLASNDCVEN